MLSLPGLRAGLEEPPVWSEDDMVVPREVRESTRSRLELRSEEPLLAEAERRLEDA